MRTIINEIVYADGSIRTIRTSAKQFKKFQQSKKREYDFDDIDLQFYYDFSGYLKKRNYAINTAGMDIFDIMKVTGHTTPEMLKRYIKADQLDVVQKLTDKYDYFD